MTPALRIEARSRRTRGDSVPEIARALRLTNGQVIACLPPGSVPARVVAWERGRLVKRWLEVAALVRQRVGGGSRPKVVTRWRKGAGCTAR